MQISSAQRNTAAVCVRWCPRSAFCTWWRVYRAALKHRPICPLVASFTPFSRSPLLSSFGLGEGRQTYLLRFLSSFGHQCILSFLRLFLSNRGGELYLFTACKFLRLNCVFQAILFYIPRWLWKNWEAGKVSALRMDLNLGIISDVEKKLKKKLLIDYLYSNLKHHNFWAYRYFFCEFLALLNVSGRISDTRRLAASWKGLARLHFSCLHLVPETLSWAVELCKRCRGGQELERVAQPTRKGQF